MTLRSVLLILSALIILTVAEISWAQTTEKPNIVLILVDDAALMDFGVYGGEANTPNIDALAQRGAMFRQFRTSPLCSPSRAMLLTGMDNHLTGVATIPEVLPAEHVGQPGYTMALEPGVLTLADHLRAEGYRTLMTGKWHLGSNDGELPVDHGFDLSFALDASGADNWEDKSYMPFYNDAPWFENREAVSLPKDFYSSEFIVEKMLQYIADTDEQKPFFSYMAFQAIHIPVQTPPEFRDNYEGVYDQGWHVLRQKRYEEAQQRGLISADVPLAPIPVTDRKWDSLSKAEKKVYSARMQVNAGMLEAMDFYIGQFIDALKTDGQFDNTIFVITSDNGPEPNRGDNDWRLSLWMSMNDYNVDLEHVGEVGSWGFIGPEWANAAASPGALYKFYMTEGGIRVPLIMSGPGIPSQEIDAMAMVTDIAPTLLEMISSSQPIHSDHKPMTGRSLFPILNGQSNAVYSANDPIGMEVSGNAALYKGTYKITRSIPPIGDGVWRLYDIEQDPGETKDLSIVHPKKKEELLQDYAAYAARVGVLEMPKGYNSHKQVSRNSTAKFLQHNGKILLLAGLLLFVILVFFLRVLSKRASK